MSNKYITVGIGNAARLANIGEYVSVNVNGTNYTCKVALSLGGTKVAVFKDADNNYYAYPEKPINIVRDIKNATFSHKQKRPKTPEDIVTYGYVLRVKRTERTTLSCTCPRWTFNGITCVETCSPTGGYSTYSDCMVNHNNPPIEDENITTDFFHPNNWIHSVGYFYRGFLDLVGAPSFENGFFYPIGDPPSIEDESYPFCRFGVIPVGTPQPSKGVMTGYVPTEAEIASGMGDALRYVPRMHILPGRANLRDVYLDLSGFTHTNLNTIANSWYYNDGLRDDWARDYRLYFNNDLTGFDTSIRRLRREQIPWESSIPVLDESGNLIYDPDPFGNLNRTRTTWIGEPNWMWREIQFSSIAVMGKVYSIVSWPQVNEFKVNAELSYQNQSGQYREFELIQPYWGAGELPPPKAAVISRAVRADEEDVYPTISPERGGSWQLLWDTRTCHYSLAPGVPDEFNLEYDVYDYYLITNITSPKYLMSLRSDDPVKIFISAQEGSVYGSILHGLRPPAPEGAITSYCKLTVFQSNQDAVEVFEHELPPPEESPLPANDWQFFRLWSLDLTAEMADNPCFNLLEYTPPNDDSATRIIAPNYTNVDLAQNIMFVLDLGQTFSVTTIENGEETTEEKVFLDALLLSSIEATVNIYNFREDSIDDISEPSCILSEIESLTVFFDKIDLGESAYGFGNDTGTLPDSNNSNIDAIAIHIQKH